MYTPGTTNSVNTVPIARPVEMTSPIANREAAPAPLANTSGSTPKTMAAVVIKIGRSRVPAAATIAACFAFPRLLFGIRHFDDENAVLADETHQASPVPLRCRY